jgi:predicted amidohydrolase
MALVVAAAQSASLAGAVTENVARHLRLVQTAADQGVQLLVFPELSLTGYEPQLARANAVSPDDPRLDPMRRLACDASMAVVVGAPLLSGARALRIAALAMLPDGSVSTYTKEHLHPGEEGTFAPGLGGPMLQVGGAAVALAICADTTHPEHAARAAARGATVYAAGVLISEKGYAVDAALMQGYAAEHGMCVLMANHSAASGGYVPAGRSAIWSEHGTPVSASSGTEEALVLGRKAGGIWEGLMLAASGNGRGGPSSPL